MEKARRAFPGYRVIIGGDWNARVGLGGGCFDPTFKGALGPFVQIPERNVNGDAVLQLCYNAKLVVANSLVMPPGNGNPLAVDVDRLHQGTFYFANQGKGNFSHYLDHFVTTPSFVNDGTILECYVSQLMWTYDDSDHRPLVMVLKGKSAKELAELGKVPAPKKVTVKSQPKRDYTAMADDELNAKVALFLSNKLGAEEGAGGLTYDRFVEIAREVADELLPSARGASDKVASWFEGPMKDELVRLIAAKGNAWVAHKNDVSNGKLKVAYHVAHEQVKKATATAKSLFWERLGTEMAEAYGKSPAKYYEVINRQIGNQKVPVFDGMGLLNKDGSVAEDAAERMKEHFESLFVPVETVEELEARRQVAREMLANLRFQYPQGDASILLSPLCLEEMVDALAKVKNTALGVDQLSAAFLKGMHMGKARETVLGLLQKMVNGGNVDPSMTLSWIIPLHKGHGVPKEECDNYRGISLLSDLGKLLERILIARLEKFMEKMDVVPNSQCAFKKGSGVDDAQWLDRLVTSGCIDRNLPLYKLYVDLKKAYDRVDRVLLREILVRVGVPEEFIQILLSFLQDVSAAVKVNGEASATFPLQVGLRQGSPASPFLYNVFLGTMLKITHQICDDMAQEGGLPHFGIPMARGKDAPFLSYGNSNSKKKYDEFYLRDVCFADDMAIPALSNAALQTVLDVLDKVTRAFGQEISHEKTEVMVIIKQRAAATAEEQKVRANLHLVRRVLIKKGDGSDVLEDVNIPLKECFVFKYLGSRSNSRNNCQEESEARVSGMCIAWAKLKKHVFLQKDLDFIAKWMVYNACVLAAGMYGGSVSLYTDKEMIRLDAKHFSFVRQMLQAPWVASKEEVIAKAAMHGVCVLPVKLLIQQRLLSKAGHILRDKHTDKEEALTRQMMFAHVNVNKEGGSQWSTCSGRPAGRPPQASGLKKQIQQAFVDFGGEAGGSFEQQAQDKKEWQRLWRVAGLRFAFMQWLICRDIERRKRAKDKAEKVRSNLVELAKLSLKGLAVPASAEKNHLCGGCNTAKESNVVYCGRCRRRYCDECWGVVARHSCERLRVTLKAEEIQPVEPQAVEEVSRRKGSKGGQVRKKLRQQAEEEKFDRIYEQYPVELPPSPVRPRAVRDEGLGMQEVDERHQYDVGGSRRTASVEVEWGDSDMDSEEEEKDDDADSVEELVQEARQKSGSFHPGFLPSLARPGGGAGAGALYVRFPGKEVFGLWLSVHKEKWGSGVKNGREEEKDSTEKAGAATIKKQRVDTLKVVDRGPHCPPQLRRFVSTWDRGDEERETGGETSRKQRLKGKAEAEGSKRKAGKGHLSVRKLRKQAVKAMKAYQHRGLTKGERVLGIWEAQSKKC